MRKENVIKNSFPGIADLSFEWDFTFYSDIRNTFTWNRKAFL